MKRGFTLIELLVVIAIISTLMAMILPLYGVMRRASMKSACEFVLKKVDTSLRLFRTDWGVYPGQAAYPDLSGGARFANRLRYHLGTDLDPLHRDRILADAAAGAAKFAYAAVNGDGGESATQPSPLTITKSLIVNEPRADWNASYRTSYAALANRMAREQVRMAAISGNLWLRGHIISKNANPANIVSDKSATAIFPAAPASAADPGPGWACDYLRGDLEERFIDGQGIRDPWGNHLVYISQNVPGIAGAGARLWEHRVTIRESKRYGMGPLGFDPVQGPGPDLKSTRPHLLFGGRVAIGCPDAGDGLGAAPAHASYLPSPGNPLGSDIRYYAGAEFAKEFELWSCGPDGAFAYMRDDPANRDNLAVVRYLKGF